jgi:hypothetical protein
MSGVQRNLSTNYSYTNNKKPNSKVNSKQKSKTNFSPVITEISNSCLKLINPTLENVAKVLSDNSSLNKSTSVDIIDRLSTLIEPDSSNIDTEKFTKESSSKDLLSEGVRLVETYQNQKKERMLNQKKAPPVHVVENHQYRNLDIAQGSLVDVSDSDLKDDKALKKQDKVDRKEELTDMETTLKFQINEINSLLAGETVENSDSLKNLKKEIVENLKFVQKQLKSMDSLRTTVSQELSLDDVSIEMKEDTTEVEVPVKKKVSFGDEQVFEVKNLKEQTKYNTAKKSEAGRSEDIPTHLETYEESLRSFTKEELEDLKSALLADINIYNELISSDEFMGIQTKISQSKELALEKFKLVKNQLNLLKKP